jgi:hypothetical protein
MAEKKYLFCSRCKRNTMKLISLTDDGKGKKYCKDCKREIRKKHPNKDYRKAKKGKL